MKWLQWMTFSSFHYFTFISTTHHCLLCHILWCVCVHMCMHMCFNENLSCALTKICLERSTGLTKMGTLPVVLSLPLFSVDVGLKIELQTGEWVRQWEMECRVFCLPLSFFSGSMFNFVILTSAFFARLSRTAEEKSNRLEDHCYYTCKVFNLGEPWVLLSKSFHLSPSQFPLQSIMLFVFACAILFLKYHF